MPEHNLDARVSVLESEMKSLKLAHDGLAACKVSEIKDVKRSHDELKEKIYEKLEEIIETQHTQRGYFVGIATGARLIISAAWAIVTHWGSWTR